MAAREEYKAAAAAWDAEHIPQLVSKRQELARRRKALAPLAGNPSLDYPRGLGLSMLCALASYFAASLFFERLASVPLFDWWLWHGMRLLLLVIIGAGALVLSISAALLLLASTLPQHNSETNSVRDERRATEEEALEVERGFLRQRSAALAEPHERVTRIKAALATADGQEPSRVDDDDVQQARKDFYDAGVAWDRVMQPELEARLALLEQRRRAPVSDSFKPAPAFLAAGLLGVATAASAHLMLSAHPRLVTPLPHFIETIDVYLAILTTYLATALCVSLSRGFYGLFIGVQGRATRQAAAARAREESIREAVRAAHEEHAALRRRVLLEYEERVTHFQ